MKSKKERFEQLQKAGIDVSQFYSATNTTSEETTQLTDDYVGKVIDSGYVHNNKTYRRWIMAQTLKMLKNPGGWDDAMVCNNYSYVFKMLIEEVKVLGKLETCNPEEFTERSQFFTKEVVLYTLADYEKKLTEYLNQLKTKKFHRQPYHRIGGYGNVLVTDLFSTVHRPLFVLIQKIARTATYEQIYTLLKDFKFVKLPCVTDKASVWVNAYKRAGAYYTFKNMIMHHNVKLQTQSDGENKVLSTVDSISVLNQMIAAMSGNELMDALQQYTKDIMFNY